MKVLWRLCLLIWITWLGASLTGAQSMDPVTWSVKSSSLAKPLKPADSFTLQIAAFIEQGWYIYSITQPAGGPISTRITLPEGQPFKLSGIIRGPAPKSKFDDNFKINTETHSGSVIFKLPAKVLVDAQAGKHNLQVAARYQACNDSVCLPPKTVKLDFGLEVAAASGTAATRKAEEQPASGVEGKNKPASELISPPPSAPLVAAAKKPVEASPTSPSPATTPQTRPFPSAGSGAGTSGVDRSTAPAVLVGTRINPDQTLFSFLWLAASVGALSLLTPCVFPMVPITVSYFTNHAAGDRASAMRDASIYALGIILTFTALGVLLAFLFGAAGINKFAANPYVNLLIAAIFISFALSLFGAYNIQIPSSVLTKLDRVASNGQSGHVMGLLLMGLTFSLTSFTCTAPFVGTLLVMAAQGDWMWPVVGMLAFSTVFALPFFILALAPQLVSQLPRSGGWLNSVKVVMGFLEIAAAMKFLSNVDLIWRWDVFTREVVLASWIAVALLIAFYLLGKFQFTHDSASPERVGPIRLMVAFVSLSLGFYLLTGLFGGRLGELESFLPPATESSAGGTLVAGGSRRGELDWMTNDYEGALVRAKQEQKLVFIDFTGYTCTNCRWMEANMFPKDEVRRELEKFVRVRLYTDGDGDIYERQQKLQEEKFGTVALPYYAVVDAGGNVIASFPGLTRDLADFVAFLARTRGDGSSSGTEINRAGITP